MTTEAQRLAALRATDSTGAYDDARPATGVDESRSLQVTIDATDRVVGVHLEHLDDHARTPRGVAALVEEAYVDAVLSKMRPSIATEQRPRPMTIDDPPHIRFDDLLRADRALAPAPPDGPDVPTYPYAEAVGRADNDRVSVTLPPAQSKGVLDIDAYWLETATRSSIAAAIAQAYEAAYRERDSHD